jgi:hypothetical protein
MLMKKTVVITIILFSCSLLYSQELIPGSVGLGLEAKKTYYFDVSKAEESFINKDYYEFPRSLIAEGKLAPNLKYILYVNNLIYRNKGGIDGISETNTAGQTIIKFNAFDKYDYMIKTAASNTCPIFDKSKKNPKDNARWISRENISDNEAIEHAAGVVSKLFPNKRMTLGDCLLCDIAFEYYDKNR